MSKVIGAFLAIVLISFAGLLRPGTAGHSQTSPANPPPRQMENLGRDVVALNENHLVVPVPDRLADQDLVSPHPVNVGRAVAREICSRGIKVSDVKAYSEARTGPAPGSHAGVVRVEGAQEDANTRDGVPGPQPGRLPRSS